MPIVGNMFELLLVKVAPVAPVQFLGTEVAIPELFENGIVSNDPYPSPSAYLP